jgi:hypothetical protein
VAVSTHRLRRVELQIQAAERWVDRHRVNDVATPEGGMVLALIEALMKDDAEVRRLSERPSVSQVFLALSEHLAGSVTNGELSDAASSVIAAFPEVKKS